MLHGPLVQGFAAPAPPWHAPTLILVSFEMLVSHVELHAGSDVLARRAGKDLLAGDHSDHTAALALVLARGAGLPDALAPALRLRAEVDALVGHLHAP